MNRGMYRNLTHRPIPYMVERQSSEYKYNALYDKCHQEHMQEKDQLNKPRKSDSRLTLQMGCGSCCKRVSNIDVFLYEGVLGENFNYGQLAIPPEGECLLVETFCNGKLVNKQISSAFGIQVSRGRTLPIVAKNIIKANDEGRLLNKNKKTASQCCHGKSKKLPYLLQLIMDHCNNQKITVEYTCGDCLKKASNIAGFEYRTGPDYVIFLATDGECIVEKALCGDKTEDAGIYNSLTIPFDNVCSIECGSVELC